MQQSNVESLVAASIFLTFLGLGAVSMLCLIIHLIYRTCKEDSKSVLFFVITTIIGITSFLLSILCVMAITLELILVHGYHFAPNSISFVSFKYLSVIFDSFGHLSMLTIFIVRLHLCFKNSIFGYSKLLRYSMFGILGLLIVSSLLIVVQIILHGENSFIVIVSQIIWELGIEGTSVWILYLFTSGLYKVLKMNLRAYSNSGDLKRHKSDLSLVRSVAPNLDIIRVRSLSETRTKSDSTTTPDATENAQRKPQQQTRRDSDTVIAPQIREIITVMNKMTFLVLIAVFASVLTIGGNILIELYASRPDDENSTMDFHVLWSDVLPAIDVVITAFMLYLQFNFTAPMYDRLCCKLDAVVLRLCLKLSIYFLKKAEQQKNQKNAQELGAQSTLQYTRTDHCTAPPLRETQETKANQPQTMILRNADGLEVIIH